MAMRTRDLSGWLIIGILLATMGCEKVHVAEEELGEIVSEVPQLAGAQDPYRMPFLEVSAGDDQAVDPESDEPPTAQGNTIPLILDDEESNTGTIEEAESDVIPLFFEEPTDREADGD